MYCFLVCFKFLVANLLFHVLDETLGAKLIISIESVDWPIDRVSHDGAFPLL